MEIFVLVVHPTCGARVQHEQPVMFATLSQRVCHAPDVISLLPGLAPDATISDLSSEVGVAGATPAPIAHTAEGLPFAPAAEFDSDVVTTELTPDEGAGEVSLGISSFTTTITGLPEALIPGGEIELSAGEGDCGDLEGDAATYPVAAQ